MILKVSNAFLTETHSSVWVLSIGKTLTQHCMGVFLVTGSRRLLCYLALNTQTRTKGFYQYFSKFVPTPGGNTWSRGRGKISWKDITHWGGQDSPKFLVFLLFPVTAMKLRPFYQSHWDT